MNPRYWRQLVLSSLLAGVLFVLLALGIPFLLASAIDGSITRTIAAALISLPFLLIIGVATSLVLLLSASIAHAVSGRTWPQRRGYPLLTALMGSAGLLALALLADPRRQLQFTTIPFGAAAGLLAGWLQARFMRRQQMQGGEQSSAHTDP